MLKWRNSRRDKLILFHRKMSASANLALSTIRRLCLAGEDSPFPVKKAWS